jgi:hypothetical protein
MTADKAAAWVVPSGEGMKEGNTNIQHRTCFVEKPYLRKNWSLDLPHPGPLVSTISSNLVLE